MKYDYIKTFVTNVKGLDKDIEFMGTTFNFAEMDGVKLVIKPEVYEFIVDKAIEYKLGARGLRSIVETIMMDIMFEIPSMELKEYELTLEYAQQQMEKANISRLQNA